MATVTAATPEGLPSLGVGGGGGLPDRGVCWDPVWRLNHAADDLVPVHPASPPPERGRSGGVGRIMETGQGGESGRNCCRCDSPVKPAALAQAETAVIEVRDLSLTFVTADGPVAALSGIKLDVGRGEFVSLIGPSGCGKTTLLRVIADLEQATGGTISVNGVTPA